MKRTSAVMLAWLMLLTGCATAPSVPPSTDGQMCPNLPALEPKVEDALEPDFSETMQLFLRGTLTLRSASEISVTPATPSTSAPKPK